MAVIDLYSPRIQTEEKAREFNTQNLTGTLNEAAKQLFSYSINKQLIDKAYAEIAAKAEGERSKNAWQDKMKANELAARRYNTSMLALQANPDDPMAWQVYSDNMFDYSGVRPDISHKKDVIDHLREHMVNPTTGGMSDEASRAIGEANKLEGPVGEIISNYRKLKEQGVADDDPKMKMLQDAFIKETSTTIDQQAGNMIRDVVSTHGLAAGVGLYEYWKTLGPPGASTNVKVQMPQEGERKAVYDAINVKSQLENIRNLYNQVKTKYGNWLNTPTGAGAETINSVLGRIPGMKSDKQIAEFQSAVRDFQAGWVHAITGAQHSDKETERYVGGLFGGGNLADPGQSQSEFEAKLDFNTKNAQRYLDALLMGQAAYGLKPFDPYKGLGAEGAPPGAAASENKSVKNPNAANVQELEQKRRELLKRKEAAGGGKSPLPPSNKPGATVEPPPEPHAEAQMFNRALALNALGPAPTMEDQYG